MILRDCHIYSISLLCIFIMAGINSASCGFNEVLSRYLDHNLKVSKTSEAKVDIERVVKNIMSRVESKDMRFQMGLEYRGSIYEKVKIKEADEFDFDLPLKKLTIDEAPRSGIPNTIPIGLFGRFTYFLPVLSSINSDCPVFHASVVPGFP